MVGQQFYDVLNADYKPRPRRAAAEASRKKTKAVTGDQEEVEPDIEVDADPDFLALSTKQRRAIDRAFDRGVKVSSGKKRKRRKVENVPGSSSLPVEGGSVEDAEEAGDFMVDDGDAGGFILDDEGGGGFVDDGDEDMGGFIPDEPTTSASASRPTTRPSSPHQMDKLPLHIIPGLLVSLGLPSDDDVLQVFKASATGWDKDDAPTSRKRPDPEADEGNLAVGLKDFRAVCAALMEPEEEIEGEEAEEAEEDTFELEGEESESSLSALSSASSDGKGKGKAPARRRGRKNKDLEEEQVVKLTTRQKEMVADIWKMVKPNTDDKPGGRVLGRNEVKGLVRNLGEMWTEDEITDMVTLFSSQHEGRGLTYDDFGVVMLRAGLV